MELDAIAGVVVGGTSLAGGVGSSCWYNHRGIHHVCLEDWFTIHRLYNHTINYSSQVSL